MRTSKFSEWQIVAVLMLLASLWVTGGCGNREADADRIVLTLAGPASAAYARRYQDVIARFEATHPHIKVKYLPIPGDYYRKVLVMIAGRRGPDVLWMGQSASEFATRGVFLDITDRIEKDVDLSDFYAEAVSWYRVGDRQYGVPFGLDLTFIVYNKRVFDEAGVSYPTNDWTYEQFLDAATRLTEDADGDGRNDRYGFSGELYPASFGGRLLTDDWSQAACDSPEMIEALTTNNHLYRNLKVAIPQARTLDESLALFRQGRVGMIRAYTWYLPLLRERLADMDWDIVCDPRIRERKHWASSQAVVVASDTRYPDEAWALCREFIGDDFQRSTADFTVPANRRIAAELFAASDGVPANMEALMVAADSVVPNPRVPRLSEMMSIYDHAITSVYAGLRTPEEAMARAAEDINRILAEIKADQP